MSLNDPALGFSHQKPKVRIVRLLGSLGLGLAAGAGAHAASLKSFLAWWIPIMVLLSIGILCLPTGVARLMQRHESKRKS